MRYKGRLTLEERERIALLLAKGQPFMKIANTINRSVSTVSREVYRNCSSGEYRSVSAHCKARKRNGIHTDVNQKFYQMSP